MLYVLFVARRDSLLGVRHFSRESVLGALDGVCRGHSRFITEFICHAEPNASPLTTGTKITARATKSQSRRAAVGLDEADVIISIGQRDDPGLFGPQRGYAGSSSA